MLVKCFPDEFAENSVRPREPRAGKFCRIIFVERFVHEAGAGGRVLQRGETALNFFITRRRQSLHDQTERPDHIHADVRAAQTARGRADAPIRIGRRQQ